MDDPWIHSIELKLKPQQMGCRALPSMGLDGLQFWDIDDMFVITSLATYFGILNYNPGRATTN